MRNYLLVQGNSSIKRACVEAGNFLRATDLLMMRILKVAIYILAALATCEFSQEAGAAPDLKPASYSQTKSQISPSSSRASDLLVQATTLSDVQGHWAQSFIEALAGQGIILGFPDGSFRPEQPVTRAQFAALVSKAFPQNPQRQAIAFVDVPAYYWAQQAIQSAYSSGFLAGYPGNVFNPEQSIPRVQALVSLSSGLKLSPTVTPATILNTYFQDAANIPDYAQNSVAAATEKRIVVSYPNAALLNPNSVATRGDVAAFIYQALVSVGKLQPLPPGTSASQYIVGPQSTAAQTPTDPPPSAEEIQKLQSQLSALRQTNNFGNVFQGSPGITIAIPSGFGADRNTAFIGATYQSSTRESEADDAAIGLGIGLGDSRRSVGVELSYTLASVTGDYTDFGEGGFNAKVHRQLPGDWAVAVGYNNFIEIGEDNDFEDSIYGVVTKILRTRENVNSPLSRVALNIGLGSGQFRSAGDIDEDDDDDNDDSVNVFGSVAVRIARPASLIAEWTGQDLAVGLSIVPIRNSTWVITPAVRDLAGEGDEARFVLGTGFSFQF